MIKFELKKIDEIKTIVERFGDTNLKNYIKNLDTNLDFIHHIAIYENDQIIGFYEYHYNEQTGFGFLPYVIYQSEENKEILKKVIDDFESRIPSKKYRIVIPEWIFEDMKRRGYRYEVSEMSHHNSFNSQSQFPTFDDIEFKEAPLESALEFFFENGQSGFINESKIDSERRNYVFIYLNDLNEKGIYQVIKSDKDEKSYFFAGIFFPNPTVYVKRSIPELVGASVFDAINRFNPNILHINPRTEELMDLLKKNGFIVNRIFMKKNMD